MKEKPLSVWGFVPGITKQDFIRVINVTGYRTK
jgi:hypothetical protein